MRFDQPALEFQCLILFDVRAVGIAVQRVLLPLDHAAHGLAADERNVLSGIYGDILARQTAGHVRQHGTPDAAAADSGDAQQLAVVSGQQMAEGEPVVGITADIRIE